MIESATHLASLGLEVFPLERMSKLPTKGTSWLALMTTDPAKIKKWLASGDLNYGVHPGAGHVIVDIDTKDGKKGDESYAYLDILHGWPETLEQSTPTGGRHLVYTTPYAVGNPTAVWPGIDIRGWHGYVVGAGSKVAAGRYEISKKIPIAAAPDWLLEHLRAEKPLDTQRQDPHVDATPGAEDRCRRFLAGLPVAQYGSLNSSAYAAACGCRDRGADAGMVRDIMATDWKHAHPLDPGELEDVILHAFVYAKSEPGSQDPIKIFTPVPPTTPPPVQTPPGEPTPEPEPAPVKSPMDRYNDFAAVCGGEIWVLSRDENDAEVWRPMNRAAFCLHFNNDLAIFDAKKGPEAIWKHWLGWPNRKTVNQVVFAPGQELGPRSLNLWRGFTADANAPADAEGEWAAQAWWDHVEETMCRGDATLAHQVLGWCAQIAQRPQDKPLWCLVITGDKGTGKNAFTDRLGELFTHNYTITSHDRYLKGNFNAHLERSLMFVLNEARCSGDEQADALLKAIVTDGDMEIERKGIDSYKRRIYARVVIQGNDDWQVKASQDERRYCVLKTGTAALERMGRLGYNKFFERMRLGFRPEHGGRNALLKRFLAYDISDVDFSRAPETKYLGEQKEWSLSHTYQWWLEGLKAGKIQGGSFPLGWPEAPVAKGVLLKARNDYVSNMGGRVGITMTRLVRDLKKCCPSLDPERKTPGKERENAFGLPTLAEARNEWNRNMQMGTVWPE